MKLIGVLCQTDDGFGADEFSIINPEHPYIVLTDENVPDHVLPLIDGIIKSGTGVPIGVIMDPEVDLDLEV